MFAKKPPHEPKLIQIIDTQMSVLDEYLYDTEGFDSQLTRIERLYELKNVNRPKPISQDTLVIAGANLAGIMLIVGHERAHVVTSKALSFLLKLR